MSTDGPSTSDCPNHCPSCGVLLKPQAVLCIACGYHLLRGHHLATALDGQREATPDDNPYASPAAAAANGPEVSRDKSVFDLTESGARRVKAVVSDAQMVFFVSVIAWCFCAPALIVIFPWYAYRLYCWHRLHNEFAELRNPNGFSPHGELAAKFQDARTRIWFGLIAGLAFYIILIFIVAIDLLRVFGGRF